MNTVESVDAPPAPKYLGLIMAANMLLALGLTYGHAMTSRVLMN